MSGLRVLMITQKVDLDDDILGFTHTWVNKLAERVERLYVLALAVGRHSLRDNVELFSMGKERGNSRLERLVNFNRVVGGLVLGRKVDVIFIHMCPRYAILAAPYAKLMRVPMVMWYAHGSVNPELRIAHSLVDKVVTSTKEGFRLKSDKVSIVGQGIDTDKFKPLDVHKEGNTKVILSVGRISPIKDYETLVKAADILVNEKGRDDLEFIIVGDVGTEAQREYLDKIKGMVKERQLERHFHFVGPVPHSEVVRYYQVCDVFVNLSHTGSLDKAVLEAMACGRMPITCNEAFADIFGDYADRLMFEKGDAGDLAGRILDVIKVDTGSRLVLGKALRDIVVQRHSVEGLMSKIAEIFKEVLGKEVLSREMRQKTDTYAIPYHWMMSPFFAKKYQHSIRLVESYLKESDVVLDIGCGDGKLTSLLAERVKKVYGIDYQILPLKFAKLLIEQDRVELIHHDVTIGLPFKAGYFDVVTAFDVIEHIPQSRLKGLLAEIRRVLKLKGLFVLTTPNRRDLRNRIWGHRLNPKHYFEFSVEEACEELEDNGFKVLDKKGIYIPFPIPKAEHYANVIPFRAMFNFLIKFGENHPTLSQTMVIVAQRI